MIGHDYHEPPQRAASSPRPQSKPEKSKITQDQRRTSDSSFLHNHHSGDPKPSRDDIEMTREIKTGPRRLGFQSTTIS
jgi:hypothetical protein